LSDKDEPLTLTVPEAGWRYLGLSRNSSYAAAERGEIPTIRVGRLLRVPVRAMERLLDRSCRDLAASEPKKSG
jgi:excisionase family DNA binding protein